MEKILTMYDEDSLYAKRLSLYLRQNTKLPFQIYPISDPESFAQFSKKKESDLLLISEKNVKKLPLSSKSGRVLYLSDESLLSEKKKENHIYKYQSADQIMREILLQYGEIELFEDGRQQKADIFMVYSPIGRSGKTSLSFEIAKLLGKNRKTLYLSLSESAGAKKHLPIERECLTEVLYHFKEKNLNPMILRALSYERESYSTILPVRSPEDINSLSSRELSLLLDKIAEDAGVSALIIDTDSSMSRYLDCFHQAKKIFMPVLSDKVSKDKLAFFEDYLKKNISPETQEKFVQCSLPLEEENTSNGTESAADTNYLGKSKSTGRASARDCPYASLKEYAESLLLHYIYEEEDKEREQYRKMVL